MKISITVPVYNEKENLPPLYDELKEMTEKHGLDAEFIFVDDGSKDGSLALLKDFANRDPRVKVISFRRNFGQTAAMSAGFRFATGDVIIPMDGDRQNDPNDVPRLLAKLDEGFDVVSGWRKDRKDKAVSRRLPSIIANRLISRWSKVHLHDYGCSLKAYRADVVKGVRLYGEMHRFIPIYATWEGAKVTELAVNHRARTAGQSKYGINRTFKVVADLMVVKFLEKYFNKPIYVFGGFGLYSIAMAAVCFVLMIYFKFWGGKTFIQTPLPVLSVTFAMIGILSFMMGLLAEMVTRTYYESQNRDPYQVKFLQNIKDSELP
jgi:glycosyltransferase involved in cell wall biosynthesis